MSEGGESHEIAAASAIVIGASAGVGRGRKDSRCLSNLARIGYANLVYAAIDPTDTALPVRRLLNPTCRSIERIRI